jgi:hypothetical protein
VEAKYGLDFQVGNITVDPIPSIPSFTWDLGLGVTLRYGRAAFYAALTTHSGDKTFTVTRVTPGSWTVTPSAGSPFAVTVGSEGVLRFTAPVGAGLSVTATKTAAAIRPAIAAAAA